jgi:hypothetical protein
MHYAQHYAHQYPIYPQHYPVYPNTYAVPGAMAGRGIWPFTVSTAQTSKAAFDTATATCGVAGTAFVAGTAGTTACTVSGKAIFAQDLIKDLACSGNAGMTLNLNGAGVVSGNKYTVYRSTDNLCDMTATKITKIYEFTAPFVGNGINVYFCADGLNVDGTNSKTAVDGMGLVVTDSTSVESVIGCSTAVLA